jgi:hypothetical protein
LQLQASNSTNPEKYFKKTANNIIDRVVPKGLRRTGVSKTASDKIGAGIGLGKELGNNE